MLDGEEISWLSPGWGGDEDGQLVNQGPGSFYLKRKVNNHFLFETKFNPVLFETKGVKVSSACGSRLPCVPCLPPLQLPQSPPRGRGGQWQLGQPSGGGGGGKLWGPSLTCKTGLISFKEYLVHPNFVSQVRVDVYYEVLCPDSRYFVQHELWPAFQKYLLGQHFKQSSRILWDAWKWLPHVFFQAGGCTWC